MSKQRVLIVEDDKNISKLVKYNLEKADYDCTASSTGERALELLKNQPVDLIILDIMLPEMDGFEVCRVLKSDKKTAAIPVLFITAMESVPDMIKGFQTGAADYITKPFIAKNGCLKVEGKRVFDPKEVYR